MFYMYDKNMSVFSSPEGRQLYTILMQVSQVTQDITERLQKLQGRHFSTSFIKQYNP